MELTKANNSPFKGYYPNVNPFGIAPRYDGNTPLSNLYNKYKVDDCVNDKISKVDNVKDANAEIEQGEIVRQELPNGGTLLHKALGKKHKDGGIPVNLPNNAFIFSNFKSTSLNKEELDTFKLGGFTKDIKNRTPSKILEKNIDLKHYNEMEKSLQESKDPVQLKTAQLMKAKYDKVVAKVAALQESKKPKTNIPNFAYLLEDTPELKEEQIQTEMYQQGGLHKSTYNDRQKFWEKQGQLMLYPEKTWNGTQHAKNGIYDQASEQEFKNRNQWFFNKYPDANMSNPADVKKFQAEYDNMYANEFNGEHYFEGSNDMGIDGKFGNHTYNAPAFIHNSNITTHDAKEFTDPSHLGDRYDLNSPTINRKNITYQKPNITINDTYDLLGEYGDIARNSNNPVVGSNNLSVAKDDNKLNPQFGDDMSWLKGYNWTPKMLSMLGNMSQYPRAYNPALSLEQPVRFREQLLSAQPGVNDVLANRYASMKAMNLYAPQSVANRQFLDSDTNKQINDYRFKVDQANQNVSNDIHNKNAQVQNQVVNSNNDRRAQYSDKMNELYQNMANERNTINATNLNLLGQGLNEQDQVNMSNDLMRRQYGWNVNQMQQSMNTPEQMQTEVNRINNLNMDENLKKIMLMNFFKKYYNTNPATNPYS